LYQSEIQSLLLMFLKTLAFTMEGIHPPHHAPRLKWLLLIRFIAFHICCCPPLYGGLFLSTWMLWWMYSFKTV